MTDEWLGDYRLLNAAWGAGVHRFFMSAGRRVALHGPDQQVTTSRRAFYTPGGFISIHFRHLGIHKRKIGLFQRVAFVASSPFSA